MSIIILLLIFLNRELGNLELGNSELGNLELGTWNLELVLGTPPN